MLHALCILFNSAQYQLFMLLRQGENYASKGLRQARTRQLSVKLRLFKAGGAPYEPMKVVFGRDYLTSLLVPGPQDIEHS